METEDRQREKGWEVWDKTWTTKEKEPEEAKEMTGRGQGKVEERRETRGDLRSSP